MKRIYLCLLSLCILCGCDVKINSTINLSDLLSSTNKVVLSDLMIEVESCSTDKLEKVIAEVNSKNISAKYSKCGNEGMNSYAIFSMPTVIVKNMNEANVQGAYYLSVNDNKVYIHSSDKINSLLQSGDDKLKVKEIAFNLINDTDQDIKVRASYMFVDEQPVVSQAINLEQYSKTNFRLSDVASRQLETPNATFQIMELE